MVAMVIPAGWLRGGVGKEVFSQQSVSLELGSFLPGC